MRAQVLTLSNRVAMFPVSCDWFDNSSRIRLHFEHFQKMSLKETVSTERQVWKKEGVLRYSKSKSNIRILKETVNPET